ncbi:MAG: signal peptidase I [Acidimicrobiia bacterium]
MTSVAETPTHSTRPDGRLPAAMLGVAAMLWYFVVALLVVSRVLPLVAGWSPVVITSGSMEPVIHEGDVVLFEDHSGFGLGPGAVVTFVHPADPDRQLTHRIVATAPDGTYVTQGDGNDTADSTPLDPAAIRGVGKLLVPFAGLPFVWLGEGNVVAFTLFVTLLIASRAYLSWTALRGRREDGGTPVAAASDEAATAPPAESVPLGVARVASSV